MRRPRTIAWSASIAGHALLGLVALSVGVHPRAQLHPSLAEVEIEPVVLRLQPAGHAPPSTASSPPPSLRAPTPGLPHRPAPRKPAVRRSPDPPPAAPPPSRSPAPAAPIEPASTPIPLPSSGAGDTPAAAPGAAPAPAGSPGAAAAAPAEPGGGSERALDDDRAALAEVQLRLAQAAQRCYPRAARRLGLTGETIVHFCVGASGAASEVVTRTSSGKDILDEAATECVVREAAPFPPLRRCVSVPVRFEVLDR